MSEALAKKINLLVSKPGMDFDQLFVFGTIKPNLSFSLPVLVIPRNGAETDLEIGENVQVAKRNTILDIKGTKVVALDDDIEDIGIAEKDNLILESRKSEFKGIDILLSWKTPLGLHKLMASSSNKVNNSVAVAKIAHALCPRYLFFPSRYEGGYSQNDFYERKPFLNAVGSATRVVALADWDTNVKAENRKKKKALYAFELSPISSFSSIHELVEGISEIDERNPFNLIFSSENDKGVKRKSRSDERRGSKHREEPKYRKMECWFCLGNEHCEKQLIIDVGDHAYIALSKGGVVDDHLLIVTIRHCSSPSELTAEEKLEIDRFKDKIKERVASKGGKSVVFVERYVVGTRGQQINHFHIQAIPIASDKEVSSELVATTATDLNLTFSELSPDSDAHRSSNRHYVLVELPDSTRWLSYIDEDEMIVPAINYPRHLAVAALSLPNWRKDWRRCMLPHGKEEEVVSNMRILFE